MTKEKTLHGKEWRHSGENPLPRKDTLHKMKELQMAIEVVYVVKRHLAVFINRQYDE